MNVLLQGIVGSTAYGLAGPDSDVDRLGVFAAPTVAFHGLHRPAETHSTSKPDATFHEAAKACRLILSGNPTASEILWLPGDLYEVRSGLGDELVSIRHAFLSAKRTRDAYLGYATSQFRRLSERGGGSFSADTRKRTSKHARHLMRLCRQGFLLYATGRLVIRLEDPEAFRDFGERIAAGDLDAARCMIRDYEGRFDATVSVLPERPDEVIVERWLFRVRRAHLAGEGASTS